MSLSYRHTMLSPWKLRVPSGSPVNPPSQYYVYGCSHLMQDVYFFLPFLFSICVDDVHALRQSLSPNSLMKGLLPTTLQFRSTMHGEMAFGSTLYHSLPQSSPASPQMTKDPGLQGLPWPAYFQGTGTLS